MYFGKNCGVGGGNETSLLIRNGGFVSGWITRCLPHLQPIWLINCALSVKGKNNKRQCRIMRVINREMGMRSRNHKKRESQRPIAAYKEFIKCV